MSSTNRSGAIRLEAVSMSYQEGERRHLILDQASAEFPAGQLTLLLGPSGSGKSTLLNLISGIDQPDGGAIWLGETCLSQLSEGQRTRIRREQIGIVFQFFNLIPTLTVLENVLLPAELNRRQALEHARQLLQRVGLAGRERTWPDRLSGGEQQRVALARALIHGPSWILADEPTGNLDQANGAEVMQLLVDLTREQGKTLIVVTHNPELCALSDVVYRLEQGQLKRETPR
jgi:putative ABC transport system ATP-binding protein